MIDVFLFSDCLTPEQIAVAEWLVADWKSGII